MNYPDLLLGLVLGLAGSAVTYLTGRAYLRSARRRMQRVGVPSGDYPNRIDPPLAVESADPGGRAEHDSPPEKPVKALEWSLPTERPGTEPREASASTQRRSESPLRSSQRVLLHLARHGGVDVDGTVPESLCQLGIGRALRLGQGTVSGVLHRLEWGGAIRAQLAHVEGHDRRMRIYLLTERGVAIVRKLYRERGPEIARSRHIDHSRAGESRPSPAGDPAPGPGNRVTPSGGGTPTTAVPVPRGRAAPSTAPLRERAEHSR